MRNITVLNAFRRLNDCNISAILSKYKKISKKNKKRGGEFSSTSSFDRFLNYGIGGNF